MKFTRIVGTFFTDQQINDKAILPTIRRLHKVIIALS
jgi:hypothetical protein